MWTEADVGRSLKRYLSLTLEGPPWRIRTERREVSDDDRPVAVIDLGDATVTRAREGTLHQGEVETLIPATISCYPEVMDGGAKGEKEGRDAAERLRAQLRGLIEFGLTVQDAGGNRDFAGPFRIPLWDYNDVPLSGADKAQANDPHDVLFVPRESLTTRILQDPEDTTRYAVICEFRVTMESPGRVGPEAEPVTGIAGTFQGTV